MEEAYDRICETLSLTQKTEDSTQGQPAVPPSTEAVVVMNEAISKETDEDLPVLY